MTRPTMIRSAVRATVMSVGVATTLVACTGQSSPSALPPPQLASIVNASAPSAPIFGVNLCAAVAIDDRTVLTAAHCLDGKSANEIDVVVGVDDVCESERPRGARHSVQSIDLSVSGRGDGAVLSITTPTPGITPLPIGATPQVGAVVTAWGWGSATPGGPEPCSPSPKILEVVGNERCAHVAEATQVIDFFCAVPVSGPNTCTGDSGGPVLDADGDLVGIVGGGAGCGPTDVGTYWPVETATL